MGRKRRNRVYVLIAVFTIIVILVIYACTKDAEETGNSEVTENKVATENNDLTKNKEIKEETDKTEQISKKKDEWIDLNLNYIGCAKTKMKYWGLNADGDLDKFQDGDLVYHIGSGYQTFSSPDYYFKYGKELNKIYDEDFIFPSEKKEGKRYVYIYARKMEWLQYNPGRISVAGGYANRAGLDWEMEFAEHTLFFYEYDFGEYGYLADMSMEAFQDEESGKAYWADEEKRIYLD